MDPAARHDRPVGPDHDQPAPADAVRSRGRPVLVFDGDCGFCTRSAELARRLRPDAVVAPWQRLDLDALGIREQDAADAVQWVDEHGRVSSAHVAVTQLMLGAAPPVRWLGRAMATRPVSAVAARVYRWVADHRSQLPGGTPACAADRH